jgi:hypothetical protein
MAQASSCAACAANLLARQADPDTFAGRHRGSGTLCVWVVRPCIALYVVYTHDGSSAAAGQACLHFHYGSRAAHWVWQTPLTKRLANADVS